MATALFALILLISALTSHLPSATAGFVVDTDGDFVRNGGAYYILPYIWALGGGLGLARTGNETCPLTVVQSRSEVSDGMPLTLSSPYRIAFLPTGLILDISFTAVPACASTPSKWTVVDEPPQGGSVKITGYENTETGWFKIEGYGRFYKLVFCPKSTDTCGDIGIYTGEDGIRRLVVTKGNPLVVVFKKADSYDHGGLRMKNHVLSQSV